MDKALRDLIDHIQFIEDVAARIHGVRDETRIFKIVTEEFVRIEPSMAGILILDEDGKSLKVAEVSVSSDIVKSLEEIAASGIEEFRTELNQSSSLTHVIEEGKTLQVTSRDISEAILPEPLASQVMEIMELGKEPSIVTPLRRRGEIIGLLMVMAPRLAEYFIPSVKNLARHISTALELADEYAERERIATALKNSEEYYRCLIENAPDMIGILDEDGSIRYVSPSVEQITGYTAAEILGNDSFDFVHPDDLEMAGKLFTEGKQTGRGSAMEVRFHHKDGSWRYAEFIAMYLLDNPAVQGVVLNCRDITERKAAEEALQQSEEKFRAIVENAPDQFVMVGPDGKISFINYTEPGFEVENVIGTSVYDYVAPGLADFYRQSQERAFRTGQSERIEVMNTTDRIYDCRLVPLGDEGRIDRLMVILTDITDRKRAEEALQRHRERLERVVKERTSSLEEANTALRVMLKTGDQLKAEVQEKVLFNVKRFALPYIDELKNSVMDERQKSYLDMLEKSLNNITAPFLKGVSAQSLNLTPTEMTVTNLIKEGKTSKEIAEMLNMSLRTVETHRYNIRSKLGLKNTTVNLGTYIASLDDLVDKLSIS